MFSIDFNTLYNTFIQILMSFLPKLILALFVLVIGFWAIRKASKSIGRALKKTEGDAMINRFLVSLVSIGLKVLLILSVASILGMQTTSFLAIFTALVFSLGTALSGNIGHFASGIMILIFRPYRVGDEVTVQNFTGVVTDIQVFHTTLTTTENKKHIIPNGLITSAVVTNFSYKNRTRINVIVNVGDEANFPQVKTLILDIAEKCEMVLKDPPCKVLVNSFNKNGLEIYVRPWCAPIDAPAVHFHLQEQIRQVFLDHNIPAPVSMYDVNIKNEKI